MNVNNNKANGAIGSIEIIGTIWTIGSLSLMSLISLIGLIGCTSDYPGGPSPTPEPLEAPITFTGGLAGEETVTRADLTGTDAAELLNGTFKIWGYKNNDTYTDGYQTVIDGYTVTWRENTAATTSTNSDGWEYVTGSQTIKFWDWSTTEYRFYGLAGFWGASAANEAYRAYEPYKTYSAQDVDATAGAGTFFSRLRCVSTAAYGQTVQLVFVQTRCKVRFMFTYNVGDANVTLDDKAFRPTTSGGTIYQSGSFTVYYPLTGNGVNGVSEWWDVSGRNGLSAMTQDYYEMPDDANARNWYYVLPAKREAQGSYTLAVTVNGEPKTAVVPAEYMQWEPGYEYTYIFKITEAPTTVELDAVQVGFTGWTLNGEQDNTVYNW